MFSSIICNDPFFFVFFGLIPGPRKEVLCRRKKTIKEQKKTERFQQNGAQRRLPSRTDAELNV